MFRFIFLSVYSDFVVGQVVCLLIVTAAAAETAIGLSLLVTAYRLGSEVSYHSLVILIF
jgi:NADH:ubiquinone oxidoreductase subunit K